MFEDFYTHVSSLSFYTLLVIGMLVGTGAVILHLFQEDWVASMMFGVGFTLGAFIVDFMATRYDLMLLAEKDANLIALTTIGMIVALGVMILMKRSAMAVADSTRTKITR